MMAVKHIISWDCVVATRMEAILTEVGEILQQIEEKLPIDGNIKRCLGHCLVAIHACSSGLPARAFLLLP